MKKFFSRLVIAIVLLLALQGPELMNQYIDHLTGHVEELKFQVEKLKEITGKEEIELKPLIATWLEKPDAREPALFISALYHRYEALLKSLEELRGAKFWNLPFVFMVQVDGGILSETLANYHWGISFTLGVIPFLGLGLLLCWLVWLPQKRKTKLPPA